MTTTTIAKADLTKAYAGSYYTICGCGGDLSEWTNGMQEFLDNLGIGTVTEWFQTTGKDINEFAESRAHGGNANPFADDITVLMFPLDGLKGGKLATFRLMSGDRWFDDIVDNMTGQFEPENDEEEL